MMVDMLVGSEGRRLEVVMATSSCICHSGVCIMDPEKGVVPSGSSSGGGRCRGGGGGRACLILFRLMWG